jgi:endoribonuclease Dicer
MVNLWSLVYDSLHIAEIVNLVLVHEVILASGENPIPMVAARYASNFALDALEGDATFLTRTCDCRTTLQARKKKPIESVLLDFEEEQDILTVEQVLTTVGNASSGRPSEEIEIVEDM